MVAEHRHVLETISRASVEGAVRGNSAFLDSVCISIGVENGRRAATPPHANAGDSTSRDSGLCSVITAKVRE
jgi:hypothetical protein